MTTKHTNISLPVDLVIGKDILELVSSAMYVDPLTIYREYIQNSADSIDDAIEAGILGANERGRIEVTLSLDPRLVRIRDNGIGVPNGEFAKRLTALGGSRKRGTSARGFRGVGRLAGLGYCQELIFRSRAVGDNKVQELRWDCRVFKKLLSDHSYQGSLEDIIRDVTTLTEHAGAGWPAHFYEVELVKPLRIRNDLLLNQEAISKYLSQVAPVPFSPNFDFGKEIHDYLAAHLNVSEVEIYIDGSSDPLYRPYRNSYSYDEGSTDTFTAPEFRTIEGVSGGISAVAWIMHHGYYGAIPTAEGIGGLRARKGNIQVGDHRIFADVFPEPRFASWTVGEVHIVDHKILPNGRRDDFEQNVHHSNLLSHLSAIGDHIARMCRSSSTVRNRIKAFEIGAQKIDEQLCILEQGAIVGTDAEMIVQDIRSEMFEIKKTAESPVLVEADREALLARYSTFEQRLSLAENRSGGADSLSQLNESDRAIAQRMIALIYECSGNRVAAKSLVDRILARLGA